VVVAAAAAAATAAVVAVVVVLLVMMTVRGGAMTARHGVGGGVGACRARVCDRTGGLPSGALGLAMATAVVVVVV
jgi:hypothetical protein